MLLKDAPAVNSPGILSIGIGNMLDDCIFRCFLWFVGYARLRVCCAPCEFNVLLITGRLLKSPSSWTYCTCCALYGSVVKICAEHFRSPNCFRIFLVCLLLVFNLPLDALHPNVCALSYVYAVFFSNSIIMKWQCQLELLLWQQKKWIYKKQNMPCLFSGSFLWPWIPVGFTAGKKGRYESVIFLPPNTAMHVSGWWFTLRTFRTSSD